MPVSIVVGGQFGSEGKGKVAHYLAQKMEASYVVRCGGPNSGHTVIDPSGNSRIFQQLPTAAILPEVKLAICAGSYIDLDILLREIRETGVDHNRLAIDPNAVMITAEMKQSEFKIGGIVEKIGSTGSGTGAAVNARLSREKNVVFSQDIKELNNFLQDVPSNLRKSIRKKEKIIIEGTQGFGLSPLHSRHYPFTTSRDTTAASFLSETGLSPLDVEHVFLVIRSFPIRVSSMRSGPLADEISWEKITEEGGHTQTIKETTSVTKCIRRVARFNAEIVKQAIVVNNPDKIILNHLDYLSSNYKDRVGFIRDFIERVESSIGKNIDLLGFGPATESIVDRNVI